MKKLLFLLAGALITFTASAQSQSGTSAATLESLSATSGQVERGVSGKQFGGDYTGYMYVFCIVMNTNEYGDVASVEPTGKVYRDDRWTGAHIDVTSEVLERSSVTYNPSSGMCNYSFSSKIGYEYWSSEGSLYIGPTRAASISAK